MAVGLDEEDQDTTVLAIIEYVRAEYTPAGGPLLASHCPSRLTFRTDTHTTVHVALAVKNTEDGGLKFGITYGDQLNFAMTVVDQILTP